MKILQVNSGTMINGALTYCKFLTAQLDQLGHEVTVACRPDSWLKQSLPANIDVVESSLSRHPFELRRMAKWIRENQFDIIHTHMSRANSFGVLMKMMTGIPVVATAHACSFQLHWPFNDFVLANSQSTFQYYDRATWNIRHKMATVHCFTELDRFKNVEPINVIRVRRQLRLKGDEFVVGLVGEVVQRKGHQYLFEAMSKIVQSVPNFKLVLIGRFHRNEPFVKKLRKLQLNNRLFRRVKWLGYRYNIEDFMTAFDICVVPSLEEPLGLVALEAFAAGTPVVSTNVGGLPEIVQHRENGLLVEPRNPQQLADAVIELAANESMRKRLGDSGRQMVERQFSPRSLAQSVEDVYRQVLEGRGLKKAA